MTPNQKDNDQILPTTGTGITTTPTGDDDVVDGVGVGAAAAAAAANGTAYINPAFEGSTQDLNIIVANNVNDNANRIARLSLVPPQSPPSLNIVSSNSILTPESPRITAAVIAVAAQYPVLNYDLNQNQIILTPLSEQKMKMKKKHSLGGVSCCSGDDAKSGIGNGGFGGVSGDLEKTIAIKSGSVSRGDGDDPLEGLPPPSGYEIEYEVQTSWTVLRQMLIPFTIAGFGSVFAGIVLNWVTQHLPVFTQIPQLSIMVPAFLGLIGNIETTLASRLSTHANLGTLDTWQGLKEIMIGNIFVVQCQSSTVGLFAALASILMSTTKVNTRSKINWNYTLMLCTSSVVTSIIANTLLATVISLVIIIARRFRVNPDNISTPVAASMGDVCSITILAFISQAIYDLRNVPIQIVLLISLLSLAPIFGYIARHNRYTKSVIITGWSAILGAVIVEQPGGIVMESAFEKYKVLSTFQPLVNGIGSNLVGIQTSRMSTFLHSVSKKGQLPDSNPRSCVGPFWVFLSNDIHARMARLLMLVVVPAHLFYMTFIYFLQYQFDFSIRLTAPFIGSYIVAILIQLMILLYLAYVSVFWAWKKRINPDNSAIPFTSALADVLGNCLMAGAFLFLDSIKDPNALIIDDDGSGGSGGVANSTTMMTLLLNGTTVGAANITQTIVHNLL